jgi:hypothetical protein
MSDFYVALGTIAPYYNLALVVVTVLLFIVLFRTDKKGVFMKPWYLFFVCICIFILEETFTILRATGLVTIVPAYMNAFFELGIIIIFVYIVLIQKEYLKKNFSAI